VSRLQSTARKIQIHLTESLHDSLALANGFINQAIY